MSNSQENNTCKMVCWAVAVVVGLLVFFWTKGALSFLLALILGGAIAYLLGTAATRTFCTAAQDTGSQTSSAPMPEPAPAPAPKPAPAAAPRPAAKKEEPEAPAPEAPPAPAEEIPDYDGDGVKEGTGEGSQPKGLSGPRDGNADDLKEIKGVGPKLASVCNDLGYYHFDQIAAWTADEVAWMDANLKGFRGRVSRDNWVEQAKILASGGETEFSKRARDGDVY